MYKKEEKIALIHIAKKQCCLSDDDYRALLQSCAGISSAADIRSEFQFRMVMSGFKKLGFTSARATARTPRSGFCSAVCARARAVLGDNYESRLAGFLRKMNRSSLSDCTADELRRVMGFISALERTNPQK